MLPDALDERCGTAHLASREAEEVL